MVHISPKTIDASLVTEAGCSGAIFIFQMHGLVQESNNSYAKSHYHIIKIFSQVLMKYEIKHMN